MRIKYDLYENLDTRLEELVERIKHAKEILVEKGDILEKSRHNLAEEFGKKVTKLHLLNMKDAVFSVDFIPLPKPTHFGLNDLCMKFTSHKNIIPQPISNGASGEVNYHV